MFKFKKFSINQENCAMKICTDACIFGGYIDISESKSILDIGTGTGLLSLMLAQRTDAYSNNDLNGNKYDEKKPNITAVEIEKNAFLVAKQNFESSIYRNRLNIWNASIQDYTQNFDENLFDHIVSNPPFFLYQSETKNNSKNLALHSAALSFDELLYSVDSLLSENGKCDILLPAYEMDVFSRKAKDYNLFSQKKLYIYTRKEQGVFRVIVRFVRNRFDAIVEENFVIYKSKGEKNSELYRGYTEQFVQLLREFYIIF